MGSNLHSEYTVIGDTVNGAPGDSGKPGTILVSADTHAAYPIFATSRWRRSR
ncbi:MAG: hypothetical protein R2873_18815 [Caldilineaceae bacterium]